jgi:hypothetical protein
MLKSIEGGLHMSVFENLSRKVTDTAKAAAKKSSEVVEVTKLNMSIGTEEDKIKKVYTEIGKSVYEVFTKGEEVNEAFKVQCELISSYEENIKEMRLKILDLKELKVCPTCGVKMEADILFCSKCGAKQ